MPLAKRVIPCLDVTAGRVVKGVNFVQLRDAVVCSNSEWVLYRIIGIGKLISCFRSEETFWYPLSA